MTTAQSKHQQEIQRNRSVWQTKPLLGRLYGGFYERIIAQMDPAVPGRVVEIGSGIGNLKSHLPGALCTDLFPNPWLDLACDGYELPFRDGSLSHLILFDVFHHLRAPNAFLGEARRALHPAGRLILFDPYISWTSYPVYGWLHPEPVAWRQPIDDSETLPRPRDYYAAQGNATRLLFGGEACPWPVGWKILHREALACFSYLLSGGFSRPSFYPSACLPWLQRWDACLSRWPRVFAGRCLVSMEPLDQALREQQNNTQQSIRNRLRME